MGSNATTTIKIIVSAIIAFSAAGGYLKGCSDERKRLKQAVEREEIIVKEKVVETQVIVKEKIVKIKEKAKNLPPSKKDEYLSCLLSSNPLLSDC